MEHEEYFFLLLAFRYAQELLEVTTELPVKLNDPTSISGNIIIIYVNFQKCPRQIAKNSFQEYV
jgi:hypothetical protein